MLDFKDDNDADLLEYMAMRDEDPENARQAWGEFYTRHIKFVYAKASASYGPLVNRGQDIEELVSVAFRRAFEYAASFSPGDEQDHDRIRRMVRAWLATIVRHEYLRAQESEENQPATYALLPTDLENIRVHYSAPCESGEAAMLREGMSRVLDERDRAVLYESMQYYDAETGQQRMSRGAAQTLAERLNTTPDNLRQIRKRALAKLAEYMAGAQAETASEGVTA